MKKILFYTLLFCLASVGFTSCNDDEELTDSKITYYPEMEIQGDKLQFFLSERHMSIKGARALCWVRTAPPALSLKVWKMWIIIKQACITLPILTSTRMVTLQRQREQLLSATLPLRLILRVNIRFKAEVIEIMDRHKRSMPSILSL